MISISTATNLSVFNRSFPGLYILQIYLITDLKNKAQLLKLIFLKNVELGEQEAGQTQPDLLPPLAPGHHCRGQQRAGGYSLQNQHFK